jgi:glutaminyl-peptide cyclotransferase
MMVAVLMSCLSLLGCEGGSGMSSQPKSAAAVQSAQETQKAQAPAERKTMAAPNTPPAPRVNPQRAMQYVKDVVNIGARSLGSPGHAKVQSYIKAKLKSDHVEEDGFTAQTPAGAFEARNIIAKYPGTKDGVIVIASHYDTNYPLKNYVGANDGGSTTGLLLELANHLRGAKREGYSVWLVWFDAEEAVKQWSPTDSLYGSRHLADKWQQDGTLPKIKAFILLDMIGDADLAVDDDANSTPWVKDLIHQAASLYGYQSHFFQRQIGGVDDDHVPFVRKGVPAVDLIDFEYGYNNVYHHTPQDTLDKLSPNSLQIIGDTVLEAIRLLNAR